MAKDPVTLLREIRKDLQKGIDGPDLFADVEVVIQKIDRVLIEA